MYVSVHVCPCVFVWGNGLHVLLVIFSITGAVVKCSFSAVSPEQKLLSPIRFYPQPHTH